MNRKTHILMTTALLGAAALGFTSCESSTATADTVNLSHRKTFSFAEPASSLSSPATGETDAKASAETSARTVLESLGYVYQVPPGEGFLVDLTWRNNLDTDHLVPPPQVNQSTSANLIQYVTFEITAEDPATHHVLWQSPPRAPTQAAIMTPSEGENFAKDALKDFPHYVGN